MRRARVSRGRMRRYAWRALESVPAPYRRAAENILFVVEPRPGPLDLRDDDSDRPKIHRGARGVRGVPLLGIYRGVPRTERTVYTWVAPDVIAIFRKPILRVCRTRCQVAQEVRLTVLHEFGHYLGLDEAAVEHL